MFSSNTLRKYLPWIAATALTAVTVTAILVISERLASTPDDEKPKSPVAAAGSAPIALAQKLLGPSANAEAFDTPFFNAKKEPLTLSDFKGEGLVVNFWATWCIPCVHEMPALDALAAKLEGRGVRVLTISQDRAPHAKVPAFLEEKNIKLLPFYYDERNQLGRPMDVQALPTTILIDAEGNEVGRVLGVLQWNADEIVEYLVRELAPKAP